MRCKAEEKEASRVLERKEAYQLPRPHSLWLATRCPDGWSSKVTVGGDLRAIRHRSSLGVVTPLWPSVGVKPNTPKVGDLESFGTPECLEFDNKAQNYSH
jgi:hypothetical protein